MTCCKDIQCFRSKCCQRFFNIKVFTFLMLLIIGVQGTYLGFIVGMQTSIETRFELGSTRIGVLLALYDIGHTLSVVLVGYFGEHGNKPRWTGAAAIISSFTMLGLALPNFIFGSQTQEQIDQNQHTAYILKTQCDPLRDKSGGCRKPDPGNNGAYAILAVSQFLAGCAMSPFNTLAYVYIDEHVGPRKSPMYLGLLTSMYAFGPALGFGLSALCNQIFVDVGTQHNVYISKSNPSWIGAWWLGFVLCAGLFLLLGLPLMCFPKRMKKLHGHDHDEHEMVPLDHLRRSESAPEGVNKFKQFLSGLKALPKSVFHLLKNPVYTSMMLAWIFGAYLVGGFGTYLPKYMEKQYTTYLPLKLTFISALPKSVFHLLKNPVYTSMMLAWIFGAYLVGGLAPTYPTLPKSVFHLLKNPVYTSMMLAWIFGAYLVGGFGTYLPKYMEKQYHISATESDIYAGVITIGSIAVGTAMGGWLLTKFNISCQRATLYLVISWVFILLTYVAGMFLGCKEAPLAGTEVTSQHGWNFTLPCNERCMCEDVEHFDPVCLNNQTYFSACHAGCRFSFGTQKWIDCSCDEVVSYSSPIAEGFCPIKCITLPIYITVTFIGLFLGNLFFMSTMMIILRAVRDEEKVLSLSFASCCTNIFGFIPGPIIFGFIIDSSCLVQHSICHRETGSCILYDNQDFRHKYHLGNALFQVAAIAATVFTYVKSRTFKFPEDDYEYSETEYE